MSWMRTCPRPHLQQSSFIAGRAFQTLLQLPGFHVVHPKKQQGNKLWRQLQAAALSWSLSRRLFFLLSFLTWCFGPDRRWRRASSTSPGPCRTASSSPPRGDSWRTTSPPPSGHNRRDAATNHTEDNSERYQQLAEWSSNCPTGHFCLSECVHTDLLSRLEVDAFVCSTAHHSNLWTLTWNTGSTGIHLIIWNKRQSNINIFICIRQPMRQQDKH